MKYHIIYRITNLLNGKYYIGKHSTNDLNDGYMGSGKLLKRAIKKHGIENFEREILYEFKTEKRALAKEKEIVNYMFTKKQDTYNVTTGGHGSFKHLKDTVTVKDKDGNFYRVSIDDPRYISGELIHVAKNTITVKDKNENTFRVATSDPRYLSGELVHVAKNTVVVKDKSENIFKIFTNDPRYVSGELVHVAKNTVTVKDKNENFYSVSTNDPRYLSGELVPIWKGRHHSEETKRKMSETKKGKHKGKLNSQWGTCWIMNKKLKKSKKIKKEKLQNWLDEGWTKGRKINF